MFLTARVDVSIGKTTVREMWLVVNLRVGS